MICTDSLKLRLTSFVLLTCGMLLFVSKAYANEQCVDAYEQMTFYAERPGLELAVTVKSWEKQPPQITNFEFTWLPKPWRVWDSLNYHLGVKPIFVIGPDRVERFQEPLPALSDRSPPPVTPYMLRPNSGESPLQSFGVILLPAFGANVAYVGNPIDRFWGPLLVQRMRVYGPTSPWLPRAILQSLIDSYRLFGLTPIEGEWRPGSPTTIVIEKK